MKDLPWVDWAAEERARQAQVPAEPTVRPSFVLRQSTIDFLDRAAQANGVTRSEMVELMAGCYRASWRPLPRSTP